MKANEVRIGNWVNYNVKPVRVNAIGSGTMLAVTGNDKDGSVKYEELEPILLTPEILEAAGLSDCEDFGGDYTYIRKEDDSEHYLLVCHCVAVSPKPIEYVHQLQNLHFALTGEELSIKL